MAAEPTPKPTVPLPTQLAWLDRVSVLSRDPDPFATQMLAVDYLRAQAADQGLVVSETLAHEALATLEAPAPVALWERPATAADWAGLKATSDAGLDTYRAHTRKRLRQGWLALSGGWLAGLSGWAYHLTHTMSQWGSMLLVLCLLTIMPWLALARTWHWKWAPAYASRRRPGEAALERLRAQLDPATLTLPQAERFAQVPGLAACLRAIRASEVPYLALDEAQATTQARRFHEHTEQQARQQRRLENEQAITAALIKGS